MIINQLKAIIKKSGFRFRQATWHIRHLPDFVIIGAQKSGTSSLCYYLEQHNQILPSFVKEVHFFDGGLDPNIDNFKQGLPWYQSHFPMTLTTKQQKIFDTSPLYLFNPLAPKRISEIIPHIKLIAILRNPTERAISHYFHEKRLGYEKLPIMDALLAEEDRLKLAIEQQDYKNNNYIHFSYKSRGLYYEQITRYLQYFPISNILVINSEDLFTSPESTLRRIFQYIGVNDKFAIKDLKARYVTNSKTQVEPGVYEYLDKYFYSHNHLLSELLGKDFGW